MGIQYGNNHNETSRLEDPQSLIQNSVLHPSLPASPPGDDVATLAYLIWEQEGRPQGREQEHWRLAELSFKALHLQEDRTLRGWEKSVGISAKRQRPRF